VWGGLQVSPEKQREERKKWSRRHVSLGQRKESKKNSQKTSDSWAWCVGAVVPPLMLWSPLPTQQAGACSSSGGGSITPSPFSHCHHQSTCDPPCKQLLMRLGVLHCWSSPCVVIILVVGLLWSTRIYLARRSSQQWWWVLVGIIVLLLLLSLLLLVLLLL
jgi:hypothetical protein